MSTHDESLSELAPGSRRQFLAAGATLAVAAVGQRTAADDSRPKPLPRGTGGGFRYCLNMSTVRGQKLSVPRPIDLAARAGYDSIGPWLRDLDEYREAGGSLDDLKKRIADAGLTVESAIGFARWIVDDPTERAAGLEQARRDMETLRKIGGTRIAAPPTGATDQTDLNLFAAAERYGKLLELGDQMGVVPQVEVWGFSKSLSRLGETLFVATESGHPKACVLPDIYHIYKGGSSFDGLKLLAGRAVHVFHMNDYPANPPRATISDADRVYPGDGVAPLSSLLKTLSDHGFRGALSLELFNRTYWSQEADLVARTGLEKMRAAVAAAQ